MQAYVQILKSDLAKSSDVPLLGLNFYLRTYFVKFTLIVLLPLALFIINAFIMKNFSTICAI